MPKKKAKVPLAKEKQRLSSFFPAVQPPLVPVGYGTDTSEDEAESESDDDDYNEMGGARDAENTFMAPAAVLAGGVRVSPVPSVGGPGVAAGVVGGVGMTVDDWTFDSSHFATLRLCVLLVLMWPFTVAVFSTTPSQSALPHGMQKTLPALTLRCSQLSASTTDSGVRTWLGCPFPR